MIDVLNVLGFDIIFFLSEIGFEFFEMGKGLILSLSHGIEPLWILLSDVFGLILDTIGKVGDMFVFFLISCLDLQLVLDWFDLLLKFVEGLFKGKYFSL